MKNQPHILLVTFPGQGHINPTLQLAKRLLAIGVKVTFSTSVGAERRMAKTGIPDSLSFSSFSDGNDDGFKPIQNFQGYMSDLRLHGSETLRQLIMKAADHTNNSHPFTCVVYSLLIPWVAKVAREFHLPSILLWSRPATVFGIYYHYFNDYGDEIEKNINDPSFLLHLPGLPPLAGHDLPSFFIPAVDSNEYAFALPLLKEHIEMLDGEANPKPKVLVNSFDAIEYDALNSINKYNLIGIGPLLPSAFVDGENPTDASFGGDLYQDQNSKSYIEWLNSKPESSVIYISFGSITVVSERQMEEMRRALLEMGRPFLWVIRENENGGVIIGRKELEEKGMIVTWCSQIEVLSHPSLGCFMTHCGWNSTTESLASGVPMVAFPQWTDQLTNAKLVQDFWKTGVRVVPNEGGIVEVEEIKRCVDLVMGDIGHKREEMRNSVKKWKDLARDAAKEGGSSHKNLKAFVHSVAFGDEVGSFLNNCN